MAPIVTPWRLRLGAPGANKNSYRDLVYYPSSRSRQRQPRLGRRQVEGGGEGEGVGGSTQPRRLSCHPGVAGVRRIVCDSALSDFSPSHMTESE